MWLKIGVGDKERRLIQGLQKLGRVGMDIVVFKRSFGVLLTPTLFLVLEIETRTSCVLDRCSSVELAGPGCWRYFELEVYI